MDLRDTLSSFSVSPRKVLKIVIGLSVVLLLLWLFTLSQIEGPGNTDGRTVFHNQETTDSLATTSSDTVEQTERAEAVKTGGDNESPDLFSNGLLTFFVLVVILGLLWFWADRSGGASESVQKGRLIESHPLGGEVQLKIIKINKEVWVMGVTASSVKLLHRYPEEEWMESEASSKSDNKQDTFSRFFRSKI